MRPHWSCWWNNWYEFVEYSGGEESAELTLLALKNAAGMDA